jgi:N-methylhydantoinase B/oxoprolinase/acetone carboxylase alpha subunit
VYDRAHEPPVSQFVPGIHNPRCRRQHRPDRADGTVEAYAVVTALEVNEDDVIHTGSGGGYGDPRRRPRELVLDDLRNGLVTEEQARAV